jgi:hypothetical protein
VNPSDMVMSMELILDVAMIIGVAIVKIGRMLMRIREHEEPDSRVQCSLLGVEGLVEPNPGA